MKDVMDLIYGAKIEPDSGGFLATFRDIENAFTEGSTYEEAVFNAQEVLDLMLLDRLEHDDDIPLPSPIKKVKYPSLLVLK